MPQLVYLVDDRTKGRVRLMRLSNRGADLAAAARGALSDLEVEFGTEVCAELRWLLSAPEGSED